MSSDLLKEHLQAVAERLSSGIKLNNGSAGSSKVVKSVKKSSIQTKPLKTVNYLGLSLLTAISGELFQLCIN